MINARKWLRRGIEEEFAGARLGDARRTSRLQMLGRASEASPRVGFPQMVQTDGELEGIYRFFSNADVQTAAILEPHIVATMRRAEESGFCLIVHDTTAFEFSGDREDLGLTQSKKRGFYAHFAVAVLPGDDRVPLGVCGLERINRSVRKDTVRKRHSHYIAKDPTRESLRWLRLVDEVESRREGFECIHIADREGDMFDLMASARRSGQRFVIRGDKERALADQPGWVVKDVLTQTKPRTQREVSVSARVPTRRELIKPRAGTTRKKRVAQLSVGSHTVEIRRPKPSKVPERALTINLVHVWERNPPKGEDPVEWVLFTTEPVDTVEQLHTVIGHYESRWVIEEFFKALKTGCAYEKRQLGSYHALSNALAVFSVVAWRMLLARAVSRAEPSAPATAVVTRTQLVILKHQLHLDTLPKTAKDATYAVARLGGHLKRNGDPGWLTLGRGFERLFLLETGWQAAIAQFS